MTNLPLDLKYRPRKFSDVVGNTSIVKLLLTRSKQGSLSGRSMMFGGPKGCGKTSLARIVARAIVCEDLVDGEPCGGCSSCQSISDESSISFDEFDAATQGTVDRVRTLIEDLEYGSLDGKPRVIVLDEAHRLSKPSQDALLKAMEDRRLVVILCTTEPRKIVEAIRSRTEEYPVSPPSEDSMVSHLSKICEAESISFESEALRIASKSLGCCPRECVCAIDTLRVWGGITVDNAKSMFRFDRMKMVVDVLTLIDSNPSGAFEILDHLATEGATWVRDTMVLAISSAIRQSIGAKSNFPIPVGFYDNRGVSWSKLAQALGSLDKPVMADIESTLLATSSRVLSHVVPSSVVSVATAVPNTQVSVVPTPTIQTPIVSTAPSKPVVVELPKPKDHKPPSNSIELDGVRYSSEENLTSLDSKIGGSSGPPPSPTNTSVRVEYDIRHAPLPEKEFASGLLKRLKGAQV
jgi:DNA polymerase III subunit gamma/tau